MGFSAINIGCSNACLQNESFLLQERLNLRSKLALLDQGDIMRQSFHLSELSWSALAQSPFYVFGSRKLVYRGGHDQARSIFGHD